MINTFLVNEGYGYVICPVKWNLPTKVFPFHRFYYVLGGRAHYSSAERDEDLVPGNLYILPSFRPYSVSHDPAYPLEVVYFHLEIMPDITNDILQIPVAPGSLEESLLQTMRHFSDIHDVQSLEELSRVLVRYIVAVYRPLIVYDPRLEKVMRFIELHLTEKITIDTLADIACMERAYFTRFFKKQYKVPPMRYVLRQKMSLAARELVSGALVSQAAKITAYDDEKAFSRAFKKIYLVPPSEYSKSHNLQP
jgi:AraC-like DNA-binding protein